jgi:hypothetical protein
MTHSSPVCSSLCLVQQHLAAFAERYYHGPLHAVQIRPLRGGLEAAGVFRVQAHLWNSTSQRWPVQFVVKVVHEEARREVVLYHALQGTAAAALAPRLLGTVHAETGVLLFLEWVQPTQRWLRLLRRTDTSWRV